MPFYNQSTLELVDSFYLHLMGSGLLVSNDLPMLIEQESGNKDGTNKIFTITEWSSLFFDAKIYINIENDFHVLKWAFEKEH